MRTPLENLIFQTGLTQREFAEKVGVPLSTLTRQLSRKNINLHFHYAGKYATLLNIDRIEGYAFGCYSEVVFKL